MKKYYNCSQINDKLEKKLYEKFKSSRKCTLINRRVVEKRALLSKDEHISLLKMYHCDVEKSFDIYSCALVYCLFSLQYIRAVWLCAMRMCAYSYSLWLCMCARTATQCTLYVCTPEAKENNKRYEKENWVS